MASAKETFDLRATFNSHKEFNEYIREKITFATEKSCLMNCSICRSNSHKMRYKIGRCNDKNCNSDEACNRTIKILLCQKKERVFYYNKGKHNASSRQPNIFGISPLVKEKLEDLIYNYDSRPKRLHIKLDKLRKKKR